MEKIDPAPDHYSRIYAKTMNDYICFLAHWDLTYKCNLRCRHCYAQGGKSKEEVSYVKAKSILDELKEMGCLYLVFSGGEILLRADFFDIASYCRKQGFALRLMTNGTLIDESISERIASLYPLTVEMSIYAADKGLHDTITSVIGSFDRTINAVRLLKKRNLRVILKFLVMQNNVKEFRAVKSLAEGLGVDFLFDFCVVTSDSGSDVPLKYRLNREQIKDFFISNGIPLLKREAQEEALLCSAGLNNIFITPHLDVYPCIGIKYKIGNLWESSLRDLWHSAKLNFIREIQTSDLYKCAQCELRQFCSRCFGIAMIEDKDLFGPSGFDCAVAAVKKEVLEPKKEMVAYEK